MSSAENYLLLSFFSTLLPTLSPLAEEQPYKAGSKVNSICPNSHRKYWLPYREAISPSEKKMPAMGYGDLLVWDTRKQKATNI